MLNSIFEKEPGFKPIVKVEYKDKEMTKRKRDNRGVIYDIHCTCNDEQWVYTLKNMEHLEALPFAYPGSVFERLSQIAEYANLTPEQQYEYDTNLQGYRDYVNTIDFAEKRGEAKGRADAFEEIAKTMIQQGMPLDKISDITGISIEKLAKL